MTVPFLCHYCTWGVIFEFTLAVGSNARKVIERAANCELREHTEEEHQLFVAPGTILFGDS